MNFFLYFVSCNLAFFNVLFHIGIQLINNVVIASGVQQSDSVIHIHVFFFQILFPFRLLHNIEQINLLVLIWFQWIP